MAKTSECIGCASDDSYLMDKQSIINRNSTDAFGEDNSRALGQHNGNGTIQYITGIDISLNKLWFRFASEHPLCGNKFNQTQIPNRIKLIFRDSELEKILSSLNMIKSEDIIKNVSVLFESESNNLLETVSDNTIDITEDLLLKPLNLPIDVKGFTANIVTLKPEVWDQEIEDKTGYVHGGKLPNGKAFEFKQMCKNGNIVAAKTQKPGTKPPKFVEIPYSPGEYGIWLGAGRIYKYNGTPSDAKTQPAPPNGDLDASIVINNEDPNKSTIPWILAILPLNTLKTSEEVQKLTLEKLLSCKQALTPKEFRDYKSKAGRFIRKYNNNIIALCKLLKYVEALEDKDYIIDCKVEFYKDDKLLIPTNRSNIKVRLNAGFSEDTEVDTVNFTKPLYITFDINDDNIRLPDQDGRENFVRLKCPASINLGNLSKIEDYITTELVPRVVGQQALETFITDNTIYSKEYAYCNEETKDIPKGEFLLALDRSDSKVNDIWKSFLSEVETGIICSVSSDPLLKDFEDTLTNNIKLSNYKSSFGTVGEKMTFYSHKLYQIEERPTNNEIVIRNKNLGPEDENAYIDCISGLFIDKLELDTSLFENTFFKDYKVNTDDNTHKFKTYECAETKKKLVAAQDLFLKARIGYPVYILKKLPNEETKYIKQIVYLNIDLPFKSKLTGDSILYHNKDFRCDSRLIFIKATVNGVESIKTLQEHFGASLTDADDFFFNLKFENNKTTYIIDSKYNKLLPQILKINQDKLEQKYGKNFEYEPSPSLERGSFNITESVYVYNKEKNTTLPCKDKINEAIRNLEAKRNRAISRYHEPLFDFLSTIHVLDQNGTVTEGFINESQTWAIYAANQAFYRKVLGGSPIYTFLQITPTGKTIGGRDSLIKRTYSTSDGEEYNRNIKTYNTSKKPSFSLNINAPKAPEIHPSLEKMLAETSDDNLLLPGKYQSEISKLKSILDDPEKYREACGRGILGEGK